MQIFPCSLFTDCINNQFLKKWMMIMIWNLHSMTKSSGWLRQWFIHSRCYKIYNKHGSLRRISIQRSLSFEMCAVKHICSAWMFVFQKKALAKSRSRDIFRWMEIRLEWTPSLNRRRLAPQCKKIHKHCGVKSDDLKRTAKLFYLWSTATTYER